MIQSAPAENNGHLCAPAQLPTALTRWQEQSDSMQRGKLALRTPCRPRHARLRRANDVATQLPIETQPHDPHYNRSAGTTCLN